MHSSSKFADRRNAKSRFYRFKTKENPVGEGVSRAVLNGIAAESRKGRDAINNDLEKWAYEIKNKKQISILETRDDYRAFYIGERFLNGFAIYELGDYLLEYALTYKDKEVIENFLIKAQKDGVLSETSLCLLVGKAFRKTERDSILEKRRISKDRYDIVHIVAENKNVPITMKLALLKALAIGQKSKHTTLEEGLYQMTRGRKSISYGFVLEKLSKIISDSVTRIMKGDNTQSEIIEDEIRAVYEKFGIHPQQIFIVAKVPSFSRKKISILGDDARSLVELDVDSPGRTLKQFCDVIKKRSPNTNP